MAAFAVAPSSAVCLAEYRERQRIAAACAVIADEWHRCLARSFAFVALAALNATHAPKIWSGEIASGLFAWVPGTPAGEYAMPEKTIPNRLKCRTLSGAQFLETVCLQFLDNCLPHVFGCGREFLVCSCRDYVRQLLWCPELNETGKSAVANQIGHRGLQTNLGKDNTILTKTQRVFIT
jgi:hypothetical protein